MEEEKPAESQDTPPEEKGAEEEIPAEEAAKPEEEQDPEKVKKIQEVNEKLGVPEKPKKGKTFQDRIDELTKKFRTAEWSQQELQQKLQDRDKDFDLLRKHNEELMGVVKASVTQPPATEGKKPDQLLKELKSAKQKAISEKQKVRDEGDFDKALKIQDQIDEFQDQINDLLYAASQAPKEEDVEKVVKKISDKEKQEDKKKNDLKIANDFVTRNEWFPETILDDRGREIKNEKFNPAKADMAMGMEARLLPKWKGSYEGLIKHVEEEVNKHFSPQAPLGKPKIPAVQGAIGVDRQVAKVQLTSEEARVARMLAPDDPKAEEKYAEQLKIIRGGK